MIHVWRKTQVTESLWKDHVVDLELGIICNLGSELRARIHIVEDVTLGWLRHQIKK